VQVKSGAPFWPAVGSGGLTSDLGNAGGDRLGIPDSSEDHAGSTSPTNAPFRTQPITHGTLALRATFLRQVLHENCSCREAVQLTIAASAAGDVGVGPEGAGYISGDPSAFNQARHKLPSPTYDDLARRVTESVVRAAGQTRLWCGRLVRLVGCAIRR